MVDLAAAITISDIPAVVTFMSSDREGKYFFGGLPIPEYMRKIEEDGAAVVGLNCARGPATILPLMKEARKVCKVRTAVHSEHTIVSKQWHDIAMSRQVVYLQPRLIWR